MSEEKKNIKTITLKIEGEKITADKFRRCVSDFYSLLDEVANEISGKRKAVEWIVSVKKGSIVLSSTGVSMNGERKLPAKVLHAIKDGLEVLKKKPVQPKYFSERALDLYLGLGSVAEAPNGAKNVKILIDKKSYKISTLSMDHVESILDYHGKAYGSVEGRLHTVSERGGLSFSIFDTLTNKSIRCNISNDLIDDATRAFRKRVYVFGKINYDKEGSPRSIRAEEIKVFPDNKELPSFSDICGIIGE